MNFRISHKHCIPLFLEPRDSPLITSVTGAFQINSTYPKTKLIVKWQVWFDLNIINVVCYLTLCTVKPVLSGYLKIVKTMVLKTNGSLMKVNKDCRMLSWSILQYD